MVRKSAARDNFWIRTADQFAGRGQGSRSWTSEAGKNLTGTLVLFPERIRPASQFDLSKAIALAGAAFLELYTADISLKWPNDLYAGNRKIGGILIETAVMGEWIDHVVMGIGININQLDFPADLPNPVSLSRLTGREYDLKEMEDVLLDCFREQYSLVESGEIRKLDSAYVQKLYRFGEPSLFRDGRGTFTARIRGVNEFGHLVLQDENGGKRVYPWPEVEMIIGE